MVHRFKKFRNDWWPDQGLVPATYGDHWVIVEQLVRRVICIPAQHDQLDAPKSSLLIALDSTQRIWIRNLKKYSWPRQVLKLKFYEFTLCGQDAICITVQVDNAFYCLMRTKLKVWPSIWSQSQLSKQRFVFAFSTRGFTFSALSRQLLHEDWPFSSEMNFRECSNCKCQQIAE